MSCYWVDPARWYPQVTYGNFAHVRVELGAREQHRVVWVDTRHRRHESGWFGSLDAANGWACELLASHARVIDRIWLEGRERQS